MKCKYEGSGVWEGRCVGTKEVDPCVGHEKCERFKPNFKTNADHIRSMAEEQLAERNVRKIKTPVAGCYDYGESYTDYYDAWETSDGSIFWTEQPAIEHELHWLKQPYKEE